MFRSIFKFCFLTAVRDYFYLGMFILTVLAITLSLFLGEISVAEKLHSVVTYLASSFRLIIIFGIITFICLQINKMYETRNIEFILSRQISRISFIMSYFMAFSALILILLILMSIFLGFLSHNFIGLANWTISIFLESMIMIAFSMTVSLIMRNTLLSLTMSYLFYFTSRIIGFLVSVKDYNLVSNSDIFNKISFWIINSISIFFPRLDLFANTNWIIYNITKDKFLTTVVTQTHAFLYITILLLISFIDIRKKEFN